MNYQKLRESRIKNAMNLTLSSRHVGKQAWTLQEYVSVCSCTERTARDFLNKLIKLGYVQKSSKGYSYIKFIPIKNMDKTVRVIAANIDRNVYIKSKSIGELFTTEELIAECKRRNIEVI